jgi:hypothetical protein
MNIEAFFRVALPILGLASLSLAAEPFMWEEYSKQNKLQADQRLVRTSWTSQRCTIFTPGKLTNPTYYWSKLHRNGVTAACIHNHCILHLISAMAKHYASRLVLWVPAAAMHQLFDKQLI